MSAKIYEFPATGRLVAVNDYREGSKVTGKFSGPHAANVSFGAWYHDEAVQAERNDRETGTPNGGSVVPFRPN